MILRSVLVYGVLENHPYYVLWSDWLKTHFPDITIYTTDAQLSYPLTGPSYIVNAIYGIQADICPATGRISISEEKKARVYALYNTLCQFLKDGKFPVDEHPAPTLGYFPAIAGKLKVNDPVCQSEYEPVIDW